MTLHTIGDSHAWLPFLQIGRAVTHYLGPVTMKRIGHHEETLLHDVVRSMGPLPLQPGGALVFSFGEVDIRCWVHVHVSQRCRELGELLHEWTSNYLDKVRSVPVFAPLEALCVLAITPPVTAAQAHNVDFPVAGSDADRARYTAFANSMLAAGCAKRGLRFLDSYSRYVGDDGMMRPELADNSVHIGNVDGLRSLLVEQGLIEKR